MLNLMINSVRYLPTPPLIFHGSKSAKFWFDFRHLSPLTLCDFKTKELVGNLILSSWAAMIELRSDSDISLTPLLIFIGREASKI